ncbi:DUF4230 domain-containing protein [Pseudarthrobacter sp. MM222]|uniref:DUF4230 domain-containing protein n=1 Tax=Pseudarthrobacter sp. MM222 TaxID=3018929 RepID=UPI0022202E8D|nr:DUF4230 domain-containing protein [Pseudarthrobacter sp. MM222]CAI3794026.1 hypothetical protein NKCBBBOE_00955 [Pseudarthrobacter sp. MM222]
MSAPKLFKRVASVVVVALAVLGIANVFGYSPFPSSQGERIQTVLLKSIKDVSQLHSAIGTFELVVDTGDDDEGMPDIIAGRRTLFVAAGTVNAHVDLAGLAEKDLTLSPDGKSVEVRLPEPVLDKPNIDHDRFKVYKDDRGVVDVIADVFDAPQQAELYKLAETNLAAAAEKSELRERAAENTKATLTSLFGSLGYQVTFKNSAFG